ncbi:MAG: hypothetical protein LBS27_00115 [Bifidobacteriaceae bacterium]|jgi:hypothetical protein|nr:hypothetical protein [Bifidobacteriaceae bacterium]
MSRCVAASAAFAAAALAISGASSNAAEASGPDASTEEAFLEEYIPELPLPDDTGAAPVAEGVVADPLTGEPQEGALVTLEAWPRPEDLAAIPVGQAAQVTTVAKAVTDTGGQFELKIEDASLVDQYADDQGQVDLDVVVLVEGGRESAGFTAVVSADDSDGVEVISTTEDGTGTAGIELAATEPLSPQDAVEESETAAGLKDSYCNWFKWSTAPDVIMQFEHLASTTNQVQGTTKYQSGRSSIVGWAASTKSTIGYSAKGTKTVTSNATYGFNTYTGPFSTRFFRYVGYDKWRFGCVPSYNPKITVWQEQYQIKPSGYAHGAKEDSKAATPSAGHCEPIANNVTYASHKATTFTGGVDFANSFATIDLQATSGRDSGISSTFKLKSGATARGFQVCGTTNFPFKNNPGALVAKPK